MRLLFTLVAHLLVTLARLAGPGGLRAVAAESVAVKHQLLIMKRSQRRGPNLTSWDRLVFGFYAFFVSPERLSKTAVILRASTLLRFRQALVKRKYRLLYTFGVAAANLDGPVVCRMFNRAIAKQTAPKYLSSDHDPLFRFHRWLANLRILEVDEIKAIPCTPRSHAFVERLIGTVRREYLDHILFWNQGDLERKLDNYKACYNHHRCHTGLAGVTPAERSGAPAHPIASLDSYRWRQHCNGLFQTPAAA